MAVPYEQLSDAVKAQIWLQEQQNQGQRGRGRGRGGQRWNRGGSGNGNRRGFNNRGGYSSNEASDNEGESGSTQRGAPAARKSRGRGGNYRGQSADSYQPQQQRNQGSGNRSQSADGSEQRRLPGPDSVYNVWALADGISSLAWDKIMRNPNIQKEDRVDVFKDRASVMRYFGHIFRSPMTMMRGFQYVKLDERDPKVERKKIKQKDGSEAEVGTAVWVFKTQYAIDPKRQLPEAAAFQDDFFQINDDTRDALKRAGQPYLRVFDRIEYEGYARSFATAAERDDSRRPSFFRGYRHNPDGTLMSRGNSRINSAATTPAMSRSGSEVNLASIDVENA